jgi:putative endopeptidase
MYGDSAAAKAKAAAVMTMETKMAKASRKLEDLRDPYANYHKLAISKLSSISASTDLPSYLNKIGVKHVDSVIVGQPEYYTALDKIINTTDLQTIKDYLAFHLCYKFCTLP